MNANTKAAPVVAVGSVKFGNDLPISIIAGPCQLESRAHALEVAGALKEIAARLKIGLVYKTSFDKANRTSGTAARGIGLKQALPIFAEIRSSLGLPVLTDVHEAAQCAEVAQAVDVLQIPAFLCRQTDLLLAAAATGKVVNVKKGQFLAPWDMANVVAKITGGGNPQRAGHRARRVVRLQHAGLRHARAADPGAHHRRAGDLRCDAFGAAAGRAGRFLRRRARIRRRCWRAPRSRSASPACSSKPIPIPTMRRRDGPNMVPLREFEGLVRRLMAFDALAKNPAA